jgi:iron-sulfur cluster assembly accessory protein
MGHANLVMPCQARLAGHGAKQITSSFIDCFAALGKEIRTAQTTPRLEFRANSTYVFVMEQEASKFAITESAAAQISKILSAEADGSCLRVAVQGGGCSGFSYIFSIDDTQTSDDLAFARDGITVLVDDMSLQYMEGSEIDWVDDLIGAAFQINNPNATASCGCGTSFDV